MEGQVTFGLERSPGSLGILRHLPSSQHLSLDLGMAASLAGSINSFKDLEKRGLRNWVVAFSGGKDSTLVSILAVEYIRNYAKPGTTLDVVYSDTLLEIPPLWEIANNTLSTILGRAKKEGLPIETHRVVAPVNQRFWVKMIGKGYPPPKPKFRWCTKRLKIDPAQPVVKSKGKGAVVLTGVRYGESAKRTHRLKTGCSTSGECGQDFWFTQGPKAGDIAYAAPVVNWKTCKVWDFLAMVAPEWGWPTKPLFNLYGNQGIRFGCWTCTLVKRDRAMEAVISVPQWKHLAPLAEFRQYMEAESRNPANRLLRPDGRMGSLTIEFRRELLRELLKTQRRVGLPLISRGEIDEIQKLWEGGEIDRSRRTPKAINPCASE